MRIAVDNNKSMKTWRYWLVHSGCISDIYPLLLLSKEILPWSIFSIDFESACSEAENGDAGGESTRVAIDCKYILWYSASML